MKTELMYIYVHICTYMYYLICLNLYISMNLLKLMTYYLIYVYIFNITKPIFPNFYFRAVLFQHMVDNHAFNVGLPDNLGRSDICSTVRLVVIFHDRRFHRIMY